MREFFDGLKSIDDIQTLIDAAQRESETLEYKEAMGPFDEQLKNEVGKDVSAFANSSGGVLIFGVSCVAEDPTRPQSISGINPKNIESFDRIVNSNVRPIIEGIERKCLPSDKPRVMAVYVPQSDRSPHQTSDGKYYHRSGTESRPMGHDLVELHFGRRRGPVLDLLVVPLSSITEFTGEPPTSNGLSFRLTLTNSGKRIGRYVEVILLFQTREFVPRLETTTGRWVTIDKLYPGFQAREYNGNDRVFYPEVGNIILEINVAVTRRFVQSHPDVPFLQWMIMADEMTLRDGKILKQDIGLGGVPAGL
jgi:hypothetical protein